MQASAGGAGLLQLQHYSVPKRKSVLKSKKSLHSSTYMYILLNVVWRITYELWPLPIIWALSQSCNNGWHSSRRWKGAVTTTCRCFDEWGHHISFGNMFNLCTCNVPTNSGCSYCCLLTLFTQPHPAGDQSWWPVPMIKRWVTWFMFPCHLVRWSNSEQKHSRDCLPLWFRYS